MNLFVLHREAGAEESEIRVGFVTYHKELHFYNVKVSKPTNSIGGSVLSGTGKQPTNSIGGSVLSGTSLLFIEILYFWYWVEMKMIDIVVDKLMISN